jgi:hypothetical protein
MRASDNGDFVREKVDIAVVGGSVWSRMSNDVVVGVTLVVDGTLVVGALVVGGATLVVGGAALFIGSAVVALDGGGVVLAKQRVGSTRLFHNHHWTGTTR